MGKLKLYRKGLLEGATIILAASAFGAFALGCGEANEEEPQPSFLPTYETTATPEPLLTPIPKPKETVEPQSTPEVLSEEEMKKELSLLGMKNPDEIIKLNTVRLVYFTILDGEGNEIPYVSMIYNENIIEENKGVWKFYDNFSSFPIFTCYSDPNEDTLGNLVDDEIKTNIKKFSGLDLKAVVPLVNENVNILKKEFGIDLIDTDWFWMMSSNLKGNSNYSAPMIEFARGYIEMVPKKYRTNASTFIDNPVITPTSSYMQNPSIEYLLGDKDIEDELEHKGRKM